MKKNFGFGLVEVMIVMLIISISAVAIFTFNMNASYTTNISQQRSDALVIANNLLNTQKNFTVLTTTAGYYAYADIVSGVSTTTYNNTTFTITETVTTNTDPDYKNVRIVVSWTDRQNQVQSVTVVSNIAGIDPALAALVK